MAEDRNTEKEGRNKALTLGCLSVAVLVVALLPLILLAGDARKDLLPSIGCTGTVLMGVLVGGALYCAVG